MENRDIANVLRETADLMEIAGEDSFRVRSYRRAADAIDGASQRLQDIAEDRRLLMEIPGIGKAMCEHIQELARTGRLSAREELLQRFHPGMLDLLKISGLGPKTIALIWDAYQAGTVDQVEKLAREQKIRILPRMGAKAEEKILKSIDAWRSLSGRFHLDDAAEMAEKITAELATVPGVDQVTVAGSFRRGRETVGDLDVLVTGKGFPADGGPVIQKFLALPRLTRVLAQGENKVSIQMHGGMQVDLRVLPPESYGAALQYFTGSKQHNVLLRQRAQRMGYKLNEYGLFREQDGGMAAGKTEAEVYRALGLDWIPPELREDHGEIEAAEQHRLPHLITLEDIRGDVHMHTTESDGRCSIEEMAAAALERGYGYIAITDHSQALAMANGLNEERALVHIARIHAAERRFRDTHHAPHFRIFAGIEVDILADGRLDLEDEVLARMDVVIGSVHSRFDQSVEQMTGRLLAAVNNPHLHLLGHPTGRLLLRREPYHYDLDRVLEECHRLGVAAEINASPERLDFDDLHARRCKERGIPLVINTDSHHTRHLDFIRFGVGIARRAWLEKKDVLNTRNADEFLKLLHRRKHKSS